MPPSSPIAVPTRRIMESGASRVKCLDDDAAALPRRSLLRSHQHESLPTAFGDQLIVLVVGAVMKLDDAGAGPRLRFALADDLGRGVQGVALEHRVGKFHLR